MPGRRRGQSVPNVYNLHVPVALAAHTSAAQALLVAVIKHLAFSREQCHAPYAQLEKHAQTCQEQRQLQLQQKGHRKRLPTSARKAVKYFEHLSAMIQLADNIPYHQLHGRAVAVLLGSSVQRPREVYCLHFPTVMHHPGVVEAPAASALSAAVRGLLRAMIMENETVTEWDEPPGPTKMWLMFQAPDGVLQVAPEGFSIRRAFNISLRKAFQVNLLMGGQAAPTPLSSTAQQQDPRQQQQQPQQQQQQHLVLPPSFPAPIGCSAGMQVDDLSQQLSVAMSITDAGNAELPPVWYQSTVHVKGLRPLSSH